jgi:hypothetical protein
VTTPAKVPSDGAQTMPLGEQAVHQRMVASRGLAAGEQFDRAPVS